MGGESGSRLEDSTGAHDDVGGKHVKAEEVHVPFDCSVDIAHFRVIIRT